MPIKPSIEFRKVEEVVMILRTPSRDDGFPDSEERVVVARHSTKLRHDQISAAVGQLSKKGLSA